MARGAQGGQGDTKGGKGGKREATGAKEWQGGAPKAPACACGGMREPLPPRMPLRRRLYELLKFTAEGRHAPRHGGPPALAR